MLYLSLSLFISLCRDFHRFWGTLAVIDEVGAKTSSFYTTFPYQLMEGNIANTLGRNINKIGHIHLAAAPTVQKLPEGAEFFIFYNCLTT